MRELLAVHAMWNEFVSQRQDQVGQGAPGLSGQWTGETAVDLSENDSEVDEQTTFPVAASPTEPVAANPAVAASKPKPNAPVQPAVSGEGLMPTYTGRIYLMFNASLTREGLESVWDAVEEGAGSGVIVDTRLVSQDDGVQVTLDLDNGNLDVAAFLRRLPGAEITPQAKDRRKVAWPATGIGINQIAGSRPASRIAAA